MTETKPPRRTQESRSAETRARLLEAAILSLYSRGYAATTTMAVAADAKVSRGAMLHQFPTKVDLMLFVVESVYAEEMDLYLAKLGGIEDAKERLMALPEVAWEVLSRPSGVAVLEILQGARSDDELARRLKPLQITIEKDSFLAIDRVADAAGVPVSPVVKRLMVWAVRGLSIAELLAEEPGEMIKSVRLLSRLLSYGVEAGGAELIEPSSAQGVFRVRGRVKPKETSS
ncbi:TetR/AcrR family transcriptional regulator [Brevundimonas nasdae]|uniref:TetR/AcrR family transcriptional regulator n=1 Tax=Brevundimonas nasdae TaxID=172043 RepID=A0ABX8TJ11_9CAUL|nr:TetR/AcrR family transcriptional regulator [Brevundimonas nasdae]QYC11216.1 TetR/AcrR family transcriptional regulator [Brevundimonas nasdae]QYC14003.1 TetR/AcrR family transcriptional regulator [Brevundimonas nasdae]